MKLKKILTYTDINFRVKLAIRFMVLTDNIAAEIGQTRNYMTSKYIIIII